MDAFSWRLIGVPVQCIDLAYPTGFLLFDYSGGSNRTRYGWG